MNLAEILRDQAAARPGQPAIIETRRGRDRSVTFAELDRRARQTAALLRREGVRAGDAVLVFQPMSAELYEVLIALFRLGAVAMFLDPSAGREHMEQCCALQPPRAFIACPRAHLLRFVSPALRRIALKFVIGPALPGAVPLRRAAALAPDDEIAAVNAETGALLTFTSGSTGQPKAALRTHGFLRTQHRVLERTLGLRAGDADLATLPIFMLSNLASGVTSLIPDADLRFPGSIEPARVAAQLAIYRPASTVASPALLERLADFCLSQQQTLPGFQKVFTGGAPVFPRVLDKLQAMAPQAEIVAVYGSTEAEPIAHVSQREMTAEDIAAMIGGRGLLAGPPIPEIQLRILPDRWGTPLGPFEAGPFAAMTLPAGQPGEIVVAGEHVLAGYLHGRGNEETKFVVDGQVWHRTGDAGYLDARGRLWLLGRCAARIADGRGPLYPFAVECAASQYPGVRRAAVVSHDGRRLLALELQAQTGPVALTPLQESLRWAALDEIRVLKRLPVDKRHNAKIDYPALKRLLAMS
jgi:acyl-CoA synthetase (AMP-forming)/AMP-acid ligase II